MKLRTKIFLTFSILATVPLVIFTAFCYKRYTETTYERMNVISSHLFENAQNAVNDTLTKVRQTAGTFNFYYNDGSSIISDLKNFKDSDSPPDTYEYFRMSQTFKRTCQNLLYSDQDIYGIYIFTPSGYIFNCTNGENGTIQSNYDFQNADWYQDTMELDGALYISDNAVHDCFTGDKQTIFFAQCLKDIYTHEVVGVLMLDCNSQMLDLSAVNTMPEVTLLTIDNTKTNDVLYTNYNELPSDFVNTGNNHHVAIYRKPVLDKKGQVTFDEDGNLMYELDEVVVPFFEAVTRANLGLPIIDKDYRKSEGWQFLFSMKQNEYFVFPNEKTGFNPKEVDLLNPDNYAMISPNLFRVQTMSKVMYGNNVVRDYKFRHHLETTVKDMKELKDIAYKQYKTLSFGNSVVKIRINHIGQIVSVGEY